jgi:hypothetical protein
MCQPGRVQDIIIEIKMTYFFKRLILGTVLTAGIFGSAALAQTRQPSADAIAASGGFSGQLYSNTALEFSMLAPGGWNFFTPDQNKAVVARLRSGAARAGDDSLAASAANTQVLFQATPPPVAGREKTALFSCGIERLRTRSTAEKYIEANKKLVLRDTGIKLIKDTYAIVFGGVNFSAFDVEGTVKDGTYRQRYVVTVRKEAAVFFVITLFDNKQDQIVEYSLKSIRFGKQAVR